MKHHILKQKCVVSFFLVQYHILMRPLKSLITSMIRFWPGDLCHNPVSPHVSLHMGCQIKARKKPHIYIKRSRTSLPLYNTHQRQHEKTTQFIIMSLITAAPFRRPSFQNKSPIHFSRSQYYVTLSWSTSTDRIETLPVQSSIQKINDCVRTYLVL